MTDIATTLSLCPKDALTTPLVERGPRRLASRGNPVESTLSLFDDGTVSGGLWECTPGRFPAARHGNHSFMLILSGEGVLHGRNGETTKVTPGAVIIEPNTWEGEWEIHETVRKFYVVTKA